MWTHMMLFTDGLMVFFCGRSSHLEATRIRLFLLKNCLSCCVMDIAWKNHPTPHSKCMLYCAVAVF